MKVVINKCFGGFGLSDEAYQWLIDNKNWKASEYNKDGNLPDEVKISINKENSLMGKYYRRWYDDRQNQDLIAVVEELGSKANSRFSDLKIVEIPDDIEYEIDDYDGQESIHEKHEVWG